MKIKKNKKTEFIAKNNIKTKKEEEENE